MILKTFFRARYWLGSVLIIPMLFLNGCSTSDKKPEEDRPAHHYALVTNLSDSFNKLYPKVYLNGQYIFRDQLIMVPQGYQFKFLYRDLSGMSHSQVLNLKAKANSCYYLQHKDGRFRFNTAAYSQDICSAIIDRTRYELTTYK